LKEYYGFLKECNETWKNSKIILMMLFKRFGSKIRVFKSYVQNEVDEKITNIFVYVCMCMFMFLFLKNNNKIFSKKMSDFSI